MSLEDVLKVASKYRETHIRSFGANCPVLTLPAKLAPSIENKKYIGYNTPQNMKIDAILSGNLPASAMEKIHVQALLDGDKPKLDIAAEADAQIAKLKENPQPVTTQRQDLTVLTSGRVGFQKR
jgi:hypothetical protein